MKSTRSKDHTILNLNVTKKRKLLNQNNTQICMIIYDTKFNFTIYIEDNEINPQERI